MTLQTKVSVVILVIVAVSALSAEVIDRRYVSTLARENLQEEMAGVVRQIGADITTRADLENQPARELELYRLLASRPDLVDAAFYLLPASGGPPELLASAGSTMLPRLERAPPVLMAALDDGKARTDLQGWEDHHRVKIAAPISLDGRVVGGAYAEFSTAQFDEVLDYQRRLSLTRRLLTETGIVLAINLFLFLKVHRPVRSLVGAMDAVARGNMHAGAPVYGADEIGRLASRFNLMVERVRTATEENQRLYEQLRQAHDDLQVRVDEATAEVRQKNRELERTNRLLSTAQREVARAQRLSAIGQLAATVAHKIGTPLTALSGHIQLLREDPQVGPEAQRRLQTVEMQIERTSKIIQDLLLYARKPELMLTPVDLNAVLEECLALLRPEMDRCRVRLERELSPALDKIEGDPQQLQEAFCNLIENALDVMSAGGVLTVRSYSLVGGRSDALVAMEIADTGPGIPPEHHEQIFQPFFSTKKAGRGTGLGLAIVHDIIRSHGGQITVHTESGKGTKFILLLPRHGGR